MAKSPFVALLLALATVAFLGSFPAVHAATTVTITTSNGSTVCPGTLGGTWSGTTCTIAGTLSVSSGTSLDVDAGVTVTASGGSGTSGTNPGGTGGFGVSNAGTINNAGTLTGTGGLGGDGGAAPEIGDSGGTGGYGIYNTGTINNEGTISGSGNTGGNGGEGTVVDGLPSAGGIGGAGGYGIYNAGTINNAGTMSGTGGTGGVGGSGTGLGGIGGGGGYGIANVLGLINDQGTISGTGGPSGPGALALGGYGIDNAGIINDDGTLSGTAGSPSTGSAGIYSELGSINEYCGVTVSSTPALVGAPVAMSCYAVDFDQGGLPTTGVTWGITYSWGPFTLSNDLTGTGASLSVSVVGSLSYSFDSPVTVSGTTYDCSSGCSGTETISGTATFSATYSAVTMTSDSCTPSPVSVGSSTTCTATVSGGSSPSGTVTFSTSSGGTSQFSSTTCTLSSGSCQVAYAPSSPTTPVTITATYGGDSSNLGSVGTFVLSVVPTASATSVSCSPSRMIEGFSTTCTATVTGSSPTGTVTFSSTSRAGSFTPSNGKCSLSAGSCSVIYSDTNAGSPTITASYAGDTSNSASSGTFSLTVSTPPPPPSGAEICQHQSPGQCFTSFIAFSVTSGGMTVNANVTITRTYGPTQIGPTEVGSPLQMAWYDVTIHDTISYTVTLPDGHTVTGTVSNPYPWTVKVVDISE